jgi:hypothetical protein
MMISKMGTYAMLSQGNVQATRPRDPRKASVALSVSLFPES